MTKKWDNKQYSRKNDAWFLGYDWDYTKENTSKKYSNYRCRFVYKSFRKLDQEYQYNVDWSDWLEYIDDKEKKLEEIEKSSKEPEKKKEAKDKLDTKPFNPDEGTFNKLFEKVKAIETDFKKTIPEKVKDAQQIMAELEEKHKKITADKQQALEKLKEENRNLATQLQNSITNGNKAQQAIIQRKMKQVDEKMNEVAEEILNTPGSEWIKKYLEESAKEKEKSFFEKIDWKNPRFYYLLGGMLIVIFGLVFLIYWIIKKFFRG